MGTANTDAASLHGNVVGVEHVAVEHLAIAPLAWASTAVATATLLCCHQLFIETVILVAWCHCCRVCATVMLLLGVAVIVTVAVIVAISITAG